MTTVKKIIEAFKDCDENVQTVAKGLIERVCFMQARLCDLEKDIKKNGMTETVYRANMVEPIQQKRAQADLYNQIIKNYTAAVSKLAAMLPDSKKSESGDELIDFLSGGKT